jgi:hypothetical protein
VEELRQKLEPLTNWMPDDLRQAMPVEAWWGIYLLVAIVFLLVLWRLVFGGKRWRRRQAVGTAEVCEDLSDCPPPPTAGAHVATVYHVPARLRLVAVAPVGKAVNVSPGQVEWLLDQIVPGLGQVAQSDQPRVRIFPPQVSHHGFAATFQRTTMKPEPDGSASHWIIVAGRGNVGKQSLAIGLAFWAEQPNTVGRLNLEPHQWLDVVRLKATA